MHHINELVLSSLVHFDDAWCHSVTHPILFLFFFSSVFFFFFFFFLVLSLGVVDML